MKYFILIITIILSSCYKDINFGTCQITQFSANTCGDHLWQVTDVELAKAILQKEECAQHRLDILSTMDPQDRYILGNDTLTPEQLVRCICE